MFHVVPFLIIVLPNSCTYFSSIRATFATNLLLPYLNILITLSNKYNHEGPSCSMIFKIFRSSVYEVGHCFMAQKNFSFRFVYRLPLFPTS